MRSLLIVGAIALLGCGHRSTEPAQRCTTDTLRPAPADTTYRVIVTICGPARLKP